MSANKSHRIWMGRRCVGHQRHHCALWEHAREAGQRGPAASLHHREWAAVLGFVRRHGCRNRRICTIPSFCNGFLLQFNGRFQLAIKLEFINGNVLEMVFILRIWELWIKKGLRIKTVHFWSFSHYKDSWGTNARNGTRAITLNNEKSSISNNYAKF